MKRTQRWLWAAALLILAVFLGPSFLNFLYPPNADFRPTVYIETAKITLQIIGISILSLLVSLIVQGARRRETLARRLSILYRRAKSCRRRLRLSRSLENLDRLDGVQLGLETLREDVQRVLGANSPVSSEIKMMEAYLHDVVESGRSQTPATDGAYEDFVKRAREKPMFSTRFSKAYHRAQGGLG